MQEQNKSKNALDISLSPTHVVFLTTSCQVKYQVVTQFVEMVNVDDLIDAEQEDVNHLINAELRKCIKSARDVPNKPYNFEVELISAETNQTNQSLVKT